MVIQGTHPVHDEDLVDAESLLQQSGCDRHRVEVAETPKSAAESGLLFVKQFICAKAPSCSIFMSSQYILNTLCGGYEK